MRVLLTGATGQLGHELTKRLQGTEFVATGSKQLDVRDANAVALTIAKYRPEVVIHGAAYTQVDQAEQEIDLAWAVNAVGTQNIAMACKQVGARLVYISSDYVFDGKLGRPYTEIDAPNPLSAYGQSKYAGEILARQLTNQLFVLRTAWLYGEGKNFVRTMLDLAQTRQELQIVDDQIGNPTSAADLADAILRIIPTNRFGTYHVANYGSVSWYGFAKKIFEFVGNKIIRVCPTTTAAVSRPAIRPAFSSLDTRLFQLSFGWKLRPWEEALKDYIPTIVSAKRDGL